VDVGERRLCVSGEKTFTKPAEGEHVFVSERTYGKFRRTFALPSGTDLNAIKAHAENGLLEITVPKPQKMQAKTVTITSKL